MRKIYCQADKVHTYYKMFTLHNVNTRFLVKLKLIRKRIQGNLLPKCTKCGVQWPVTTLFQ